MKIVNYNNYVQLGVKNFKNNENKETTTQTFKYKTNPNVSYTALNSSFFNNQKLLLKNTKLKNCPISFKANPIYKVHIPNLEYTFSMLQAIRYFYYGCEIGEMNFQEVKKLSNNALSDAKKAFEENIKENGFPVLKIDPEKSKKENKNILNNHLKKLNYYILLINASLRECPKLSTSYFMKDSEAFSKIPDKDKDYFLEIQNNIFQTILLKIMPPTTLKYNSQQTIIYPCERTLKDHLQPYLFIEDIPSDKAQKVTGKIKAYVENFMKITLCEAKIKLFDKKKAEAQNLLAELEKSDMPQVTEAEAERNAEELCAEIEAEQKAAKAAKPAKAAAKAAAKRKKKKRKTSSDKKVQTQQQTKPSKQEKIEKKVEISDEEKSSPSTTPSVLNPDTISTLSLESSDIDPETYETFGIAENDENSQTLLYLDYKISDLKEHHISQYNGHQHIKYNASQKLTEFFMKNVYNSKNLDKSIKDKLAWDANYSHFVGSFLVRFQESKPEATVEDCLNACIEILNNGVVLHPTYSENRTQLDLYSKEYKSIIPFSVDFENKIHLKTMFIPTEKYMSLRFVANPTFENADKFQSLSAMHKYLSDDSKPQYYYTLCNSIEDLKEFQDRKYTQ